MFRTFNVGKWKRKWLQALVMGRTFALLSIGTAMFFIVLGLGGMAENKLNSSPLSSMKGVAAQLSTRFFVDMMALEMPSLPQGEGEATLTRNQVAQFLVRLATNVNPLDPKTLLAGEVPGINRDAAIPLRLSIGNQTGIEPQDYSTSLDKGGNAQGEHGGEPPQDVTHGEVIDDNDNGTEEPPKSTEPPTKPGTDKGDSPTQTEGDSKLRKVVFIYHSHNRESFNPLLKKESSNPNDPKKNITLVGKRLQEQLEKRGIGASHSNKDYSSSVEGYNWNMSYKYSKQTVKQAMSANQELQFFFDIHRDSNRRKESTVTINGKDYARVYFIIGHLNPNWKKNEQFANEIHERLEKNYPGISRGIFGKTALQGNGEYNQSLSPNSVVIEVGGVDNTMEELYRTADILADYIADIVQKKKDAKPVNKPIPNPTNGKNVGKTVMGKTQSKSVGTKG
ncbi:stage II sporulation protein P [Paenibacillus popilliae]|uniref:Stage II sporulation protein P n=1 Tax=Paenibacillus popilliae TaxID=78057 RepID=A0ABY3ARW8_PAEPP|nr:stage II sporulation protein P [Paenibacillus sp. SDF0028]TQR45544.1 stage II sporulation protein P [Paenibacillus sp. SDF0028]